MFEKLPQATLAAVVIAAVIELVDIPALRRLYRIYAGRPLGRLSLAQRPDFLAALAALGVLSFDTLPGLLNGPVERRWPASRQRAAGPDRRPTGRERPLLRQRRHRARPYQ